MPPPPLSTTFIIVIEIKIFRAQFIRKNLIATIIKETNKKSEFLKNANLTLFKNVLDKKSLLILNNSNDLGVVEGLSLASDNLPLNSINLVDTLLNVKKTNFLESGKIQFFKKNFLFLGLSDEKLFKLDLFRKNQELSEKKLKPHLSLQTNNLIKT
jgi:hypothetical protein